MAILNGTSASSNVHLATFYTQDASEAYMLAVGTYFAVGALSVFIWDLLYNLMSDYLIARMHQMNIPLAVYFISRISTLCFAMMGVLGLTVPITNCQLFSAGILGFYNTLISSTMLLSYFRVCAVWDRSRSILVVFGFLWVVGVAGSLTTVAGLSFDHFDGSPYCTEIVPSGRGYVGAAVFGPTINHLIVFVATTYGLCRSYANFHNKFSITRSYRVFVLGESLPAFSKAVLQASQLCYLVAMLAGMAALVWFYVFAPDPSFRLAIFVPYAITVNIMFSGVFRKAKLGVLAVSSGQDLTNCQTIARPETNKRDTRDLEYGRDGDLYPVHIEVKKVIEHQRDFSNPQEGKSGNASFLKFVV